MGERRGRTRKRERNLGWEEIETFKRGEEQAKEFEREKTVHET